LVLARPRDNVAILIKISNYLELSTSSTQSFPQNLSVGSHPSNEIQFLQSYASAERQLNALLTQYVSLMILELQVSHEIL
jgi:hypothetical protein